jgi:hypothetical protein
LRRHLMELRLTFLTDQTDLGQIKQVFQTNLKRLFMLVFQTKSLDSMRSFQRKLKDFLLAFQRYFLEVQVHQTSLQELPIFDFP